MLSKLHSSASGDGCRPCIFVPATQFSIDMTEAGWKHCQLRLSRNWHAFSVWPPSNRDEFASTRTHAEPVVRRMTQRIAHIAAGPDSASIRHQQRADTTVATALQPGDT